LAQFGSIFGLTLSDFILYSLTTTLNRFILTLGFTDMADNYIWPLPFHLFG